MTIICRWWRWLEYPADGKAPDLQCPAGHRIPWDHAFVEAGYPRCKHRHPEIKGQPECGKRLFFMFFPRIGSTSQPVAFTAEVTYEEIQRFTKEGMDGPAILAALSCFQSPRAA